MLDVHGVTGSSPVPRTMVKSPETTMVSGLFVILTKGAAGIIWKTLRKVAETDFSGFLAAAKKAASLTGEAVCFCVFRSFLAVRPTHEVVQRHMVHVRQPDQRLHIRLTSRQLVA